MGKSGTNSQLLEIQDVWAEESFGIHWHIVSKGKISENCCKRPCNTLNGRSRNLTFFHREK